MEEIIAKGPWSFNNRLILQKRFHGDTSPSGVKFHNAQFWICVFNIPIKSMNRDIGIWLGNEIGDLVAVDVLTKPLMAATKDFANWRCWVKITWPRLINTITQVD